MSGKSSLLALVAAASLGAFALPSTDALAFRGAASGAGMRPSGSGMHVSGGMHLGGGSLRYGGGHHDQFRRLVRTPPPSWWPHHHHHWAWWHWPRPYWVAPVVATGAVASYAATPTYNQCTCLTKDYTPEGAVVFKDTCTNEMAMNPPDPSGPAQQQSSAEPQSQAQ
jgi:hypothetical protein